MEGKKYYTPELEEFHVGFEYEYKDGPESDFEPKIHTVFTEQEKRMWVHEFREFEGKYVTAPIFYRVKYLDREDIESLGWKKFNGFNNNFCRETFTTYEREDGYLMTIHNNCYEQAYWFYIHNQKDGNEQKHEEFRIKIKNKSELKKVLKMLGI